MRFLKNFGTYAVADILGKSALLILSPFLTRLLTQEQYGSLVLFSALWALFSVFQFLGMDSAYEIYRGNTQDDNERALIQGTATKTVYIGFAVLWVVFSAATLTSPVRSYLGVTHTEAILLNLGLIPSFIAYWTTYVFRYNHLALPFSRINYLVKTICPVLAVPFLVSFSLEQRLSGFLAIVCGLQLLSMAWVWRELHSYKMPYLQKEYVSKDLAKEMMRFGLPFIPGTILYSLIFYSDRLIVGYWLSTDKAAVIGLATQLAMFVGVIKGWFSLTWNPTLVELLATKDPTVYLPKLNLAIVFISGVFFPLTLLSKIWGPDVIAIMYPESFAEVGDLLPIISLSVTLSSFSLVAIATLILEKTNRYRNLIFGGGLLLNFGVCVATISTFGVKSAVFGIWAAELFILAGFVFVGEYVLKNLKLNIKVPILISILIMVFVNTFEFGYMLNKYAEKGVLTGVVMLVCLVWVRGIVKQFLNKKRAEST